MNKNRLGTGRPFFDSENRATRADNARLFSYPSYSLHSRGDGDDEILNEWNILWRSVH